MGQKLEGREDRRDRTWRHGRRERDLHLKRSHPDGVVDCICERSVWFFAKKNGRKCDCRRRGWNSGPKVPGGMCHRAGDGGKYHPCVAERIAGKRLARRWEKWVREREANDFEG